MKRDLRLCLQDILDCIEKIEEYTQSVAEEQFSRNTLLQDAVVRRLEVIGEAAKHIPRRVRDRYPEVPWQDVVGMRNRLSHEYFGVRLDRVWEVLQQELDALKTTVVRMKEDLARS